MEAEEGVGFCPFYDYETPLRATLGYSVGCKPKELPAH